MFLFVPLLSIASTAESQTASGFSVYTGKVLHQTDEGRWCFELFGNDIIKTTFTPVGYSNNEQLSDAVIGKPYQTERVRIRKKNQKIEFDDIADIVLKYGKYNYHFHNSSFELTAEYFTINEFRGFRFQLDETERIFGGGERGLPMNRRGQGFSLYNAPAFSYSEGAENLNFSIPFIISSRGYGIFFDNPSRGYIDAGKKDASILEAGFTSGELTYYIIHGRNTEEILRRYTALVGRQPLPARWVLGNLMSRFGYRSEEQLSGIIEKMQEEDFPIDAAILDLFWFGDSIRNTMGNLEFVNTEKWPDAPGMMRRMKDKGINTVLIAEPYFVMGTKNYAESKEFHSLDSERKPYTLTDFYFGFSGLIDIFRKDAQDWFWSKYKTLIEMGVSGWWGDLGEPETHPDDVYHDMSDLGHERLFAAAEVHNIFGHYWNRMLSEKYRQDYPDTRLFNLNRAGFAGSQRFSVFPWSGDVQRSWSGLRAQLPVMLGMSISGIPYIHADAGGFAGGTKDPELYTRWLQFAAFTPVFRPHGTALEELGDPEAHIESEPVFFPDPFKSIVRNYIKLRYQLLPYNYTLSYRQTREGAPLTRPMFYNDSSDQELFEANDQYMWGEHILVAPVLESGAIHRSIYLPKGVWYKMNGNAKVKGGQRINEKVSIDQIPLYVKAGSFIPTQHSSLKSTMDYSGHKLQVTYYPTLENSDYTLFDDNGRSRSSLEKGDYELIYFAAFPSQNKTRITVSSNQGSFEGKPTCREILLKVPAISRKPENVKINGRPIPLVEDDRPELEPGTAAWDKVRLVLNVSLLFTAEMVEVIF
ncbi:MAG: TIM-barrel domain-containing protein [Chitinophagaceae bacterium]